MEAKNGWVGSSMTRAQILAAVFKWLPSIKWEPIPSSDCINLDLSPMWSWEGLYVEWRGRGVLLIARVRK